MSVKCVDCGSETKILNYVEEEKVHEYLDSVDKRYITQWIRYNYSSVELLRCCNNETIVWYCQEHLGHFIGEQAK